jgi:hypothetical protein
VVSFENLVDAYGVVIAVTAIVMFGVRRHLLRGPDRPDASTLDGEQVAYLTGGPRRFAAAALARHRIAGDPPPADLNAPAAEVRRRLLDDGWLVPDRRQVSVVFCAMTLGYLAGAGFIGAVVAHGDEPVGRLALQALAAVALAVPIGARSDRYRSVHRELRRLRGTAAHLRPAARPALRTYGPASAALAVGLFGAAAMTSADPGFATVAAAVEVDDPEAGDGTAGGCGGCGCGGCGG